MEFSIERSCKAVGHIPFKINLLSFFTSSGKPFAIIQNENANNIRGEKDMAKTILVSGYLNQERKMQQNKTVQKVQTIVSRSNERYRWDLISKYAIAQSLLGVNITYDIKRKMVGTIMLEDAPIIKLERLLKKLRREYVKLHPRK